MQTINDSPLGQQSAYETQYNPKLLFPVPRALKRAEIQVPSPLPFQGYDAWTAYELSWLDPQGKPCVAIADVQIPAESTNLIESKSMKLYFNSFNQTQFIDPAIVATTIQQDLSRTAGADVIINLDNVDRPQQSVAPAAHCLDDLKISIDTYQPQPTLLQTEPNKPVTEAFISHLLKSNCLVTGQPDWGSIYISYHGPSIQPESLLRYIISFRNHNEFHEQCVERIFMDIKQQCQPTALTVYARYTRRGGIDINPFRSDCETAAPSWIVARQ